MLTTNCLLGVNVCLFVSVLSCTAQKQTRWTVQGVANLHSTMAGIACSNPMATKGIDGLDNGWINGTITLAASFIAIIISQIRFFYFRKNLGYELLLNKYTEIYFTITFFNVFFL